MTGIGGGLGATATIAGYDRAPRPFAFNYSDNPEERHFGKGWPTCPTSSDLALVSARNLDGSTVRITVHIKLAVLAQRLLQDTCNMGYHVRATDTGAMNCRAISGTSSPSYHSWGVAVDINWTTNPNTRYGSKKLITDFPQRMVDLWAAWGFAWGGAYLDTMHMEFMGSTSQADVLTAKIKGSPGTLIPGLDDNDMADITKAQMQQIADMTVTELMNRPMPGVGKDADGNPNKDKFADTMYRILTRLLRPEDLADLILNRPISRTSQGRDDTSVARQMAWADASTDKVRAAIAALDDLDPAALATEVARLLPDMPTEQSQQIVHDVDALLTRRFAAAAAAVTPA